MKYIKYIKTTAFVLAIFSLLVALAGLGIGVCSYVCHLVRSHDSSPLPDILLLSPFAFTAVTIFGVSRIMLLVSKHSESIKQVKNENTK